MDIGSKDREERQAAATLAKLLPAFETPNDIVRHLRRVVYRIAEICGHKIDRRLDHFVNGLIRRGERAALITEFAIFRNGRSVGLCAEVLVAAHERHSAA